jgi:hypothetical protein
MQLMSKKKILGVLAAAALLTAAVGGSASADVVVNAGTLDFDGGAPAISDFAPVTLNGTPQLTSLTVDPFTVVDATGSEAGWHVLLTVPDLVRDVTHQIDASNISMTAPNVTATAGSSMTGVSGQTSAGGFGTGEKIVIATATNGAGTYLVSPRILKLTVPATTAAGTYVSTATIATVSGP